LGWLWLVDWVGDSQFGESFEYAEGYAPFARVWGAWYADGVCASDVCDDGIVLGECDSVACCDYIVDADEGCAETIWHDGELVRSYASLFVDWFEFHVAVADGCSRGCGVDVLYPV
jgi:hypothetical protein